MSRHAFVLVCQAVAHVRYIENIRVSSLVKFATSPIFSRSNYPDQHRNAFPGYCTRNTRIVTSHRDMRENPKIDYIRPSALHAVYYVSLSYGVPTSQHYHHLICREPRPSCRHRIFAAHPSLLVIPHPAKIGKRKIYLPCTQEASTLYERNTRRSTILSTPSRMCSVSPVRTSVVIDGKDIHTATRLHRINMHYCHCYRH